MSTPKEETGETVTPETAETAEPTTELGEKVARYRQEGLKPLQIAQKCLEENIDLSVKELSALLKLDTMTVGRCKGGIVRRMNREQRTKDEAAGRSPSPTDDKGAKISTLYRSEARPTAILKEILETHPDINAKQIKEVLSWSDMTPGGMHPSHLAALLQSFRGVDSRLANMIAQKYGLALNKANMEAAQTQQPGAPGVFGNLQQQPQQQFGQFGILGSPMGGLQQQAWGGQQRPPPGFYTQQQVDRMINEKVKETRLENVEKISEKTQRGIEDLRKELPRIIQDSMPSNERYEQIEVPIDASGNPCSPDVAVSIRKITRPMKAGGEDTVMKTITLLKDLGVIGKKDELTVEKVKNIVDEAGKPKEKSADLQRLETLLDGQAKKFDELKDKLTEDEKQRMRDDMTTLKGEISQLRTSLASSGVNTAEGVIAAGIGELGKHHPIQEAGKILQPILQSSSASAPATPSARRGIIEELGKKGLVTTIRERVAAR